MSICFQNLDDSSGWNCSRLDGKNLIDEWLLDHPNNSLVVQDLTGLNNLNAAKTDHLLGLFARADMSYDDKRNDLVDPSLSQMVVKAIEVCLIKGHQERNHLKKWH